MATTVAGKLFDGIDFSPITSIWNDNLPKEVDFTLEAENMKDCYKMFEDDPRIIVPKAIEGYVTEKVLTMTYEEGINVG